jgi:hypothetical protein
MAVDRSHGTLPPEAALREYYGAVGHELSAASSCGSVLYDRENDIIVEAKLEGLTKDEGSIAKKHLEEFTGMGLDLGGLKPLVLFDRGYPSKGIIRYLENKGLRYGMRVQKGFNSLIDEMWNCIIRGGL